MLGTRVHIGIVGPVSIEGHTPQHGHVLVDMGVSGVDMGVFKPVSLSVLSQVMEEVESRPGTCDSQASDSEFNNSAKPYINWAASMVVSLETGMPWVICQQDDAPDPIAPHRNPRDDFPTTDPTEEDTYESKGILDQVLASPNLKT
ncbi:Beta-galactosidase 4 [Platanthera zijinensis]|uniref:Beta-galactosidase 4 n=1 Tax=Platanthera zijinensis TaxID=2320716 RepID=A0AAP0G9N8_9ASPA